MNKATIAEQAKTAGSLPSTQGMLQRKCSCGSHTVGGGECEECAKKKNSLQRKLAIGASNDPLELEADRIADQVMRAPAKSAVSDAPVRIQRYAGQATEDAETAPASVASVLAGPGKPLEPALRQDMEQRFGQDFSRVRVHSGAAAEQSARDVSANAYTMGSDLVFAHDKYVPGTTTGKQLLAHELVHVVQQNGHSAGRGVIQREPKPGGAKPADKTSQIKKGPASDTPALDLMPSVNGAPCACLVVIHNDERGARMTARLLHDQCSYNLALVIPDKNPVTKKGTRVIDIPNVGTKDPNELFPENVVEECMTDEQACKEFLQDKASSTDPKETLRFAQTQFFLTIKECSDSFTLPVVGLHNNRTNDTAAYLNDIAKKKINVDDLKGDIEKTDSKKEKKKEKEKLDKLRKGLNAKVAGAGKLLDAPRTTNIFRWCKLPEIGKCHIGDPQHPDNVIWVTNIEDFEDMSKAETNVVLQTAIGKESKTDLSTVFLFLKKLSESQLIQELIEDLFSPDLLLDLLDLNILMGIGSGSTTIDLDKLRFINIEGAGLGYDSNPTTERIRNYEAIVTALKATSLYCCGDDSSTADKSIKNSLALKEEEVNAELMKPPIQRFIEEQIQKAALNFIP